MNGKFVFRLIVALVVIVAVAGLTWYAYSLGISQGVAQSGNLPAPQAGAWPYPYYPGLFFRPFGFLGCLFPLFFFFLIFGLLRWTFWRGHLHHGGWHTDYESGGVPSRVEEWHRKMHEDHEAKSEGQG